MNFFEVRNKIEKLDFYAEGKRVTTPSGHEAALVIARCTGAKRYKFVVVDFTSNAWAELGEFAPKAGDCPDCGLAELIGLLKDYGLVFDPVTEDELLMRWENAGQGNLHKVLK